MGAGVDGLAAGCGSVAVMMTGDDNEHRREVGASLRETGYSWLVVVVKQSVMIKRDGVSMASLLWSSSVAVCRWPGGSLW